MLRFIGNREGTGENSDYWLSLPDKKEGKSFTADKVRIQEKKGSIENRIILINSGINPQIYDSDSVHKKVGFTDCSFKVGCLGKPISFPDSIRRQWIIEQVDPSGITWQHVFILLRRWMDGGSGIHPPPAILWGSILRIFQRTNTIQMTKSVRCRVHF